MKLDVEYIRALQYHQQTSSSSQPQPTTIFSEFQKKLQLTGDVTYRLRVKLSNEMTRESTASASSSSFWDLDIPLDLSLFVRLTGGSAYLGCVTSSLSFPPLSNPFLETGNSNEMYPTIEKISPSKANKNNLSSSHDEASTTSSSAYDHCFYSRLYSLSFFNKTTVQQFPSCSAFTATRYPDTQNALTKEVMKMKLWTQMKLNYSFNSLLKVIFDIDSIKNYERMFSLIMKVSANEWFVGLFMLAFFLDISSPL
jgi:hypothetical protein